MICNNVARVWKCIFQGVDMSQTLEAINKIYNETKDFLLIGLTVRTGSGYTTTARKLA